MDEQHAIPYLREIVVFLIAAGIVVPIFYRLRVSPVLGYLIVGAVIGPMGSVCSPTSSAGSRTP